MVFEEITKSEIVTKLSKYRYLYATTQTKNTTYIITIQNLSSKVGYGEKLIVLKFNRRISQPCGLLLVTTFTGNSLRFSMKQLTFLVLVCSGCWWNSKKSYESIVYVENQSEYQIEVGLHFDNSNEFSCGDYRRNSALIEPGSEGEVVIKSKCSLNPTRYFDYQIKSNPEIVDFINLGTESVITFVCNNEICEPGPL